MTLRPIFILALLPALMLLAGCQPGDDAAAPTIPLEERIQQRWGHLIERDFEAAWQLHSPGFRETTSLTDFMTEMALRPIRVLSAEVVSLDCEPEICDARVAITYRIVQGPTGVSSIRVPTQVEERWILHDGQWWFLRR